MRGADTFRELRGARVRLRDEGSGPPVLLLHCWALDLDMWESQAAALRSAHRVIRYDRRGFGLSTGEPSLDDDVEDVLGLLADLVPARVALVGASQAARAVLRAALAAPLQVACLVLDSPPDEVNDRARSLTAADVPLARWRELALRGELGGVRAEWLQHPFTELHGADPAARELVAEMVTRYPGRDLLTGAERLPSSLGERVRGVEPPALVINGEHDSPSRLAAGALLASTLPHARREIVPGAGHLPNLDRPVSYNRALVSFFKEFLDATH